MPYDFKSAFEKAVPYAAFLEKFGTAEHRQRWQTMYDKVHLTEAQTELLRGFRRQMRVLCLSGTWCGDCVHGCPIFQKIAEACPLIDLRFANRPQQFNAQADDWETKLAVELSICGAPRVPTLVFISEDWFECERFGERTLATYRNKALSLQGAACPTGLFAPPQDLLAAIVAEWLGHFERVQLMLLTSPRLQKMHGEM